MEKDDDLDSRSDDLKRRWKEIELKFKFSSCDEAQVFWEVDWTECPVCGEKIQLLDPLSDDDYFIPVHKEPELLRN